MSSIDDNYINRLYDEWNVERAVLMTELKNDKDLTREKFITPKISTIDVILKSLLKYRNLKIKERTKLDGF